jgi:hypothetical protein
MTKDRRYTIVKNEILGGHVKTFREIFDIIPKTVVTKDMKIHNIRFNMLIDNVSRFELDELYRLAALLDLEEKVILDLAHAQFLAEKKSKKKK